MLRIRMAPSQGLFTQVFDPFVCQPFPTKCPPARITSPTYLLLSNPPDTFLWRRAHASGDLPFYSFPWVMEFQFSPSPKSENQV